MSQAFHGPLLIQVGNDPRTGEPEYALHPELTEVQARHCVNTDRSLTDLERRIVAHMIDSKWGPDPVRN